MYLSLRLLHELQLDGGTARLQQATWYACAASGLPKTAAAVARAEVHRPDEAQPPGLIV